MNRYHRSRCDSAETQPRTSLNEKLEDAASLLVLLITLAFCALGLAL